MSDYYGSSGLGYLLTLGVFYSFTTPSKIPGITPTNAMLKLWEVSHATFLKKKNIYNFNSEVDFLFVAL